MTDRLSPAEQRIGELTTAIQHINFAAEQLREAMQANDEAFDLLAKAQSKHRAAMGRVREAEKARQEAMAAFIVEDAPAY